MDIQEGTVLVFTRDGIGHGPADLQRQLAEKFLTLTLESEYLPERILFYTDGVRLACEGSPVIEQLRKIEAAGVDLVLCQTCLNTFGLTTQVLVGTIGGMGDILTSMQQAKKVVSL